MNNQWDYDVVVVGSGSGGYICAIRASQLGLKTACIEEAPVLGGACFHYGCIPSKTLLHSSELYLRFAEEAASRGIPIVEQMCNFPLMMDKKTEVVEEFSEEIKALLKKCRITIIHGRGRLVDPHTVSVFSGSEQKRVTAKSIVLATGSSPIPLPFLPFDEKKVLSSTGALSLESLPKKMTVVGGGIIGIELASVYSRLGTEVTVVEMMPSICTGIERALTQSLYDLLRTQKIQFFLGTQIIGAKDLGEKGIQLWIRPPDGVERAITSSVVLVSIGKSPRSNDLGLLELNIDITGRGSIITDANFRTSLPNIYAIGDLIEGPRLAHRAFIEAVAVAEIIAGKSPQLDYMTIPTVIYTSPEVATIGFSEEEARDLGRKLLIGHCSFRGNPRARYSQSLDGLVKVVADAESQRILGIHILANHASEMIAVGALALSKKVTLSELGDLPFPYPTYSEAIKEACLHALKRGFHI